MTDFIVLEDFGLSSWKVEKVLKCIDDFDRISSEIKPKFPSLNMNDPYLSNLFGGIVRRTFMKEVVLAKNTDLKAAARARKIRSRKRKDLGLIGKAGDFKSEEIRWIIYRLCNNNYPGDTPPRSKLMSIDTACTWLARWMLALKIETGFRQTLRREAPDLPTKSAKEWDRVLVVKQALMKLYKTWDRGAVPGVHRSQSINSRMSLKECVQQRSVTIHPQIDK